MAEFRHTLTSHRRVERNPVEAKPLSVVHLWRGKCLRDDAGKKSYEQAVDRHDSQPTGEKVNLNNRKEPVTIKI